MFGAFAVQVHTTAQVKLKPLLGSRELKQSFDEALVDFYEVPQTPAAPPRGWTGMPFGQNFKEMTTGRSFYGLTSTDTRPRGNRRKPCMVALIVSFQMFPVFPSSFLYLGSFRWSSPRFKASPSPLAISFRLVFVQMFQVCPSSFLYLSSFRFTLRFKASAGLLFSFGPIFNMFQVVPITKASYASWSSSCFSKEYARGWIRGFPDTIRLNPPLAACNPEVVGSTPPPSIESKTMVFTVFFALQGCETQVKCTILRFCSYHSIWVALIGFKYSMKKKFHRGRVLHDGRVGFHLGGVFFRHVQATFP